MKVHNVVILGGGPAGLTSAIYTARALLEPVVIEGIIPGGQIINATNVENFPGFPDGISGFELIERFHKQAERFGVKFIRDNAVEVDFSISPFKVITSDGSEFYSRTVIVATGAFPKRLSVPGEDELLGRGVSTCATCDGALYRDGEVAVIGGGNSAIEDALFLTRFVRKCYLIHRRDELRATKILQEHAFNNEKINLIWNTVVKEIKDPKKGQVEGLILRDTKTNEEKFLKVDGVFVAIGHQPNTAIFKGQLVLDEFGYIKTFNNSTATSVKGVFACGDVIDRRYRQLATAVGSGAQAGMDAEQFLKT